MKEIVKEQEGKQAVDPATSFDLYLKSFLFSL